jgi:hypothetical protein
MSDYKIEAATKEEWAIRALNAEERNKELTLQLLAVHGQAADVLDKLAKAVEALKKLDRRGDALETFDTVVHEIVTAVLAELEIKE